MYLLNNYADFNRTGMNILIRQPNDLGIYLFEPQPDQLLNTL